MSESTVATTILEQLGGVRFVLMTGAKNLIDGGNYLTFKLPARTAKQGINYVKITLTPDDLYTVEFGKIVGVKSYTVIDTQEGIYCDMLQDIFTEVTGLYTRL